jgi:hypothetical protein
MHVFACSQGKVLVCAKHKTELPGLGFMLWVGNNSQRGSGEVDMSRLGKRGGVCAHVRVFMREGVGVHLAQTKLPGLGFVWWM